MTVEVAEVDNTKREKFGTAADVRYFDHQPGDATRYVLIAFDMRGKGVAMDGVLGYVGEDAIFAVCGMTGRAYLFHRGDQLSELYIAEKFALTNEHSIHHYTELTAAAIFGEVVGCAHRVRPT